MNKKRVFFAKLFFIIFISSLIFSYGFGLHFSEHNCIGNECKVCYEINLMKNIFDNLLVLVLICSFISEFRNYIIKLKWSIKYRGNITPVKLKVKLIE